MTELPDKSNVERLRERLAEAEQRQRLHDEAGWALHQEARARRQELYAEAALLALEAVDPMPILQELGLRDPQNLSELTGLASVIGQAVTDSILEAVRPR